MIAIDGEHPSLEDEEISHQQSVGGLRILTWNINGIRSLVDFPKVLQELPADVICLQETKVTIMLSFLSSPCMYHFTETVYIETDFPLLSPL